MRTFDELASPTTGQLTRMTVETLQVNVGKVCNQACNHCHVEAGPKRTESMNWPTMQRMIDILPQLEARVVDITGGAPELNPHFTQLVETLHRLGYEVIVRCNLTVVEEPGMHYLPDFYRTNNVHIIASLPCYTEKATDAQRGKGVFHRSIDALKKLNDAGYGTSLPLDFVYNPSGPLLPPVEEQLERQYKMRLREEFGIEFSRLLTITNVPIGRFAQYLKTTHQYDAYMALLRSRFNPHTVPALMCRNLINIGWDGTIYDCDFNAMAQRPILDNGKALTLWTFDNEKAFATPIATSEYCYACAAGCGSGCIGALTVQSQRIYS